MISKTIILSGENKGRGILTLCMEDGLLKAKLRLYEIERLNQYCKLAVYHKQQVYSANLIFKNGAYFSSLVGDFDMNEDFYTAIVDTVENNNIIISGGSYAGYFFEDNGVFDNLQGENQQASSNESNLAEPQSATDILNEEKLTKDSPIAMCQNPTIAADLGAEDDRCANCKYKEYFYQQHNNECKNVEVSNENVPENNCNPNVEFEQVQNKIEPAHEKENLQNDKKTLPTILESLLPQFEYIFNNYQENGELNSLIPNSKFVSMEDGGDNYSLGAIYEHDQMKYICYAVKCNYNSPAPEELGKFYQWLPLDSEDPLSDGYYLVYQDATDLKIIEV